MTMQSLNERTEVFSTAVSRPQASTHWMMPRFMALTLRKSSRAHSAFVRVEPDTVFEMQPAQPTCSTYLNILASARHPQTCLPDLKTSTFNPVLLFGLTCVSSVRSLAQSWVAEASMRIYVRDVSEPVNQSLWIEGLQPQSLETPAGFGLSIDVGA